MPAPTSAWAMRGSSASRPAPGPFAGAEQGQPEQAGADHPRRRGDQPDLDRVADQEDGREHQRDAAEPDQQPPRDQPLEQAAQRLVRPCLLRRRLVGGHPVVGDHPDRRPLLFGIILALRLGFGLRLRHRLGRRPAFRGSRGRGAALLQTIDPVLEHGRAAASDRRSPKTGSPFRRAGRRRPAARR